MTVADEPRGFELDGYVIKHGVMTADECDELNELVSHIIRRAAEGCRERGRVPGFWETMHVSRRGLETFWDSPGELLDRPLDAWERSVMRLGHGLHDHDPLFSRACRDVIEPWLLELSGGPVSLLQSAVIYKPARSSSVQFGMHQDASYLSTEPESLLLGFLALDDMTPENGCLEVIPGSHRGAVDTILALGADGFRPVGESRPPPRAPGRPLPLSKGDLAVLHGRLYHASGPNRTGGPRRALLVHAMSASSRLSPTSWLIEPSETSP